MSDRLRAMALIAALLLLSFLSIWQGANYLHHSRTVHDYDVSPSIVFSLPSDPSIVDEQGLGRPVIDDDALAVLYKQATRDDAWLAKLDPSQQSVSDNIVAVVQTAAATLGPVRSAESRGVTLMDAGSADAPKMRLPVRYRLTDGSVRNVTYLAVYQRHDDDTYSLDGLTSDDLGSSGDAGSEDSSSSERSDPTDVPSVTGSSSSDVDPNASL